MSSGRPPRRLSDPTTQQEVRGARVSLKNEKKKKKTKKGNNKSVPEPADADEGFDDGESSPRQDITNQRKEATKENEEERRNKEDRELDVTVNTENETSGQRKGTRQKEEKLEDSEKQRGKKSSKGANQKKKSDKDDDQENKAEIQETKANPVMRKSSMKRTSADEDVPDGALQRNSSKSVTYSAKDQVFSIPARERSNNSLDSNRSMEDGKKEKQEPEPEIGPKSILRPTSHRKRTSSESSTTSSIGKRDSLASNVSNVDADDEDDLAWLKQLLVIKILFVDILCSMGDHFTDFLQGFNLMFDFSQFYNPCLWVREESWEYGALILAINWSPGLVAALHLLAYHRKEVAADDGDEPDSAIKTQYHKAGIKTVADDTCTINVLVPTDKSEEERDKCLTKPRKKFILKIALCLFFYPIVPAIAYFKILWWWNVRELSNASFHRAQRTAHVAHSITGGFEAPVQLILTLWLIMRGVFDNPISTVIKGELPKDRFGNNIPLPAIPLMSIVFSIFSIILASLRLNLEIIPLPKQVKISKMDWFRMTFTPALSRIPFYLCSILFKISSFAFQWIFLDLIAFFPNLLIWFVNLCIGYYFYSESKLPKRMKRHIMKAQESLGGEETRTEQAVWLSSFIGLFLPCCYSQNLDTNVIENMKAKDYEKIINHIKTKQTKILRCQQGIGTFIHLVVILTIWILVNFDFLTHEPFKYNHNKFTQNSFNIFCLVMIISGLMNLIFCFEFDILNICGFNLSNEIDYKAICKESQSKEKKDEVMEQELGNETDGTANLLKLKKKHQTENIFKTTKNECKQVTLILLGIMVVLMPFVLGYAISAVLPQDNGFIIIRPDATAPDDKMLINITKMYSVNTQAFYRTDFITGVARTCKHYNNLTEGAIKCPDSNLPEILIMDLQDDAVCFEDRYDTVEEISKTGLGAMILLENWKSRTTSPYPRKVGEKYVDFLNVDFNDKTIEFPIVTVRHKDVVKMWKNEINCKEVTIVFDNLEKQLEEEDSPLYQVDCDLQKGSKSRIAWRYNKNQCQNNKHHIFFSQVSKETVPIRCIDVEIKCYDKGLKCTELVRFQQNWNDKQKKISNVCKKKEIPKSTEKTTTLQKIKNATKPCKSTGDIHFKERIPLVCKRRNEYHNLDELLCSDTKYLKADEKFWLWGKQLGYPENMCCNTNKKKIMYSEECKIDLDSFKTNQTEGWSKQSNSSACLWWGGDVLSKKSYRFLKFNKDKTPGCVLIEETKEWCEKDNSGLPNSKNKDEYENDCQKQFGQFAKVPKCGY